MPQLNEHMFSQELQRKVRQTDDLYAPLRIVAFNLAPPSMGDPSRRVDAELVLAWKDRTFRFIAEFETRTSPRIIEQALERLRQYQSKNDPSLNVLLLVPNLTDAVIERLKNTGLCGADLNGNYLIQTPDLVATRLDRKNKYPASRAIKNVYRGASSIVCRFLLRQARSYRSVTEIHQQIKSLGGTISLSTVSKVLSALHDELILEKEEVIKLLQPDKLLRNLHHEYQAPRHNASLKLKLPGDRAEHERLLTDLLGNAVWVWDGLTSAVRYATTTPSQEGTVYARQPLMDDGAFTEYRSERFYNCVLNTTQDDFVFFDRDGHWTSEIEACLALSQGDKRERETAQDLEARILSRFNNEPG